MARNLATIQRQIDKLQKEADKIKSREAIGVIDRIKVAIAFYGLTPADLFGNAPAELKTPRVDRRTTEGRLKPAAKKKAPSVVKFQDEAGHTWGGQGKRPNWFKAALESGKTPDDLRLKAP
jgi:DNA-binding protein H-NS